MNNKISTILFGILILTAFSLASNAQPFSATNMAIVNNTNNPADWGRGFEFTPNSTIYLTSLGKRVPNAFGLYHWEIWNVNTGTLVHSQAPAINGASITPGVYEYEPISAPVSLIAGTRYTLTLYGASSANSYYYYGNSTQINSNLTYHTMRYCNRCFPGTFPTFVLSGYHYGLPDFEFQLTPVVAATEIPTVSEWGLIFLFLGLLSAGGAWMFVRRKNLLEA